jgi:hypothetical protein
LTNNSSLGGLNAAGPAGGRGIIVNCPIIFVPAEALLTSQNWATDYSLMTINT